MTQSSSSPCNYSVIYPVSSSSHAVNVFLRAQTSCCYHKKFFFINHQEIK
uniref:Uncharacterized protein n=1 Tax=Amphimedon queenslandica TaxID=400682 RepID=A0A1X7US81_AMPQE